MKRLTEATMKSIMECGQIDWLRLMVSVWTDEGNGAQKNVRDEARLEEFVSDNYCRIQ